MGLPFVAACLPPSEFRIWVKVPKDLLVVMDDEDRSWGPRRYAAGER